MIKHLSKILDFIQKVYPTFSIKYVFDIEAIRI